MIFEDRGEFEIENYEYTIAGTTYYLFLKVSYEVRCDVVRHDHSCPVGEDYPDGEECQCIDLTIDEYEVWGDDTMLDIQLSQGQIAEIESSLYEKAEEHYGEFGSWR